MVSLHKNKTATKTGVGTRSGVLAPLPLFHLALGFPLNILSPGALDSTITIPAAPFVHKWHFVFLFVQLAPFIIDRCETDY